MSNGITEDVSATADLAMSDLKQYSQAVHREFQVRRPTLTPLQVAQLMDQMIQQWPPVPLIWSNGVQVTMSPYIAALHFAEGGKQVLQRSEKVFGEAGY